MEGMMDDGEEGAK